jgi:hypothetical protein
MTAEQSWQNPNQMLLLYYSRPQLRGHSGLRRRHSFGTGNIPSRPEERKWQTVIFHTDCENPEDFTRAAQQWCVDAVHCTRIVHRLWNCRTRYSPADPCSDLRCCWIKSPISIRAMRASLTSASKRSKSSLCPSRTACFSIRSRDTCRALAAAYSHHRPWQTLQRMNTPTILADGVSRAMRFPEAGDPAPSVT